MEKPDTLFRRYILPITLIIAELALSGCTQPKERDVAPSVAALPDLPSVIFKVDKDDSSIAYIDVFPGTSDDKFDKKPNGYYPEGTTHQITCQQEGRPQASPEDPSKISIIWYEMYRPDGLSQFVSAALVDLVPTDAKVPKC